jgi:predicted SnoaL-like aldol condensation-catalyzing enzyme
MDSIATPLSRDVNERGVVLLSVSRAASRKSFNGFPQKSFWTVDSIFGEGEFVAAHGPMTMKDKDGKFGSYRYCDIYRFRDGKIVDQTSYVVKTEAKAKGSGA